MNTLQWISSNTLFCSDVGSLRAWMTCSSELGLLRMWRFNCDWISPQNIHGLEGFLFFFWFCDSGAPEKMLKKRLKWQFILLHANFKTIVIEKKQDVWICKGENKEWERGRGWERKSKRYRNCRTIIHDFFSWNDPLHKILQVRIFYRQNLHVVRRTSHVPK